MVKVLRWSKSCVGQSAEVVKVLSWSKCCGGPRAEVLKAKGDKVHAGVD